MVGKIKMKVPPSQCPYCDYKCDGMTEVKDGYAIPKEGDVSLCINCSMVLIVTAERKVRIPTPQEEKEAMQNDEVRHAQRCIRKLDRSKIV